MSDKIYFKLILTGKLGSTNEGAISEIDLSSEAPIESALVMFKNTLYFSVDSLLTQFGEKLLTKQKELEEKKQKVEKEKQKELEEKKQKTENEKQSTVLKENVKAEPPKAESPKAGPPAVPVVDGTNKTP